MEFTKLNTTIRAAKGKGPARRMRTAGLVPGVVYGKGIDTMSVSVNPRELAQALSGPLHTNTVLELDIAGGGNDTPKSLHVLVRDHQYHPVRRVLTHVDFHVVDVEKPVRVNVPFVTFGRSLGVKEGGTLSQIHRELPVVCLPNAIPAHLDADVTNLLLNMVLAVKDLALPEGVTVDLPPDTTLVSVVTVKIVEEKTEAAAEGEAAAAAAPEDAKGDDDKKKE
jgi:large subunit ribosomal protein L25